MCCIGDALVIAFLLSVKGLTLNGSLILSRRHRFLRALATAFLASSCKQSVKVALPEYIPLISQENGHAVLRTFFSLSLKTKILSRCGPFK